jgi:hypothetical protein
MNEELERMFQIYVEQSVEAFLGYLDVLLFELHLEYLQRHRTRANAG